MEKYSAWGHNLRLARRRLNESQEVFAKRFGVSTNTVSRWETGTYRVSPEVMWWLTHEGNNELTKLRELVEIQGRNGNWNYDQYMRGMYNGMELMLAVLEDREPKYRHAPDRYLYDIRDKRNPELLTEHAA